ncbi:hypothetical protein ACR78Z_10765 [Sphingobacterium thalpophilum]|uniref:hypothetical protein n=1 Tax=Sphingobacterium thalpophilum TaxID=259 RepID=UPI003DA66A78
MENDKINVIDLNVKTDIFSIFDNTLNGFSKDILIDLLQKPLVHVNDINNRQQIFKGFISNSNLLERYYYNSRDFYDVHSLLTNPTL